MKVLESGHLYELENFDKPENRGQYLQFIDKRLSHNGNPQSSELILVTIHDGTTNEDVLKVLIDRIKTLNEKFPCRENSIVITKLEESLMWLNHRTELRKAQGVEGTASNHKESL